jgi:hypothetical protein
VIEITFDGSWGDGLEPFELQPLELEPCELEPWGLELPGLPATGAAPAVPEGTGALAHRARAEPTEAWAPVDSAELIEARATDEVGVTWRGGAPGEDDVPREGVSGRSSAPPLASSLAPPGVNPRAARAALWLAAAFLFGLTVTVGNYMLQRRPEAGAAAAGAAAAAQAPRWIDLTTTFGPDPRGEGVVLVAEGRERAPADERREQGAPGAGSGQPAAAASGPGGRPGPASEGEVVP